LKRDGSVVDFDIKKVARYKEKDIERLLHDAGIIRNRLKVSAAIYNAQQLLVIQKEFGSFRTWLDIQAKDLGQDKSAWLKLFKKHFKFVGGEIVGEFLMSIGLHSGSHDKSCHAYKK
jgi:DNA-3-methyladenine glycosylase I